MERKARIKNIKPEALDGIQEDMAAYTKQNELLLTNLRSYYERNDFHELDRILKILNGESTISLRILDWFVTNYAKQKYVVYDLKTGDRFKVYNDYKLKLKAYSKKRFDPFCRWDKIVIPYRNNQMIQTTIGYHFVLVVERDARHPLAPDALLFLQHQAVSQWLKQKRSEAKIGILVP
jgi:hypothetical protein